MLEAVEVDSIPDDEDVDGVGIESGGEVANEVDGIDRTDFTKHFVYHLVDPEMLEGDAVEFGEHRKRAVHMEPFALAFPLGCDESGFFEAVQLDAQGVRVFTELFFQSAEIAALLRVQEEPGKEAKAGAGLDEGFEQGSVWGRSFAASPLRMTIPQLKLGVIVKRGRKSFRGLNDDPQLQLGDESSEAGSFGRFTPSGRGFANVSHIKCHG